MVGQLNIAAAAVRTRRAKAVNYVRLLDQLKRNFRETRQFQDQPFYGRVCVTAFYRPPRLRCNRAWQDGRRRLVAAAGAQAEGGQEQTLRDDLGLLVVLQLEAA